MRTFLKVAACMAAMLSLVAASCRKVNSESRVSLAQDTIEVPPHGGTFSVYYTIKSPVGTDLKVQTATQAEWIRDLNGDGGSVTFSCTGNDTAEQREATVEVTYHGHRTSFTVTQQCSSAPFAIKMESISYRSATYGVEAEDSGCTYYTSVISTDTYNTLGSQQKLIERDIKWLTDMASSKEMTLKDYLRKVLYKGSRTGITSAKIAAGTDHYAYAFGLNEDGTATTEVAMTAFTTEQVEMLPVTFGITYEISHADVSMSITPSDNSVSYCYNAMDKSDYDSAGSEIAGQLQGIVDMQIDNLISAGMSLADAIADITAKGPYTHMFTTLTADTEYVGYAFSISAEGNINSAIATEAFTTQSVDPSDNDLAVNIIKVHATSVDFAITTTNNDPYTTLVRKAADCAGKSDTQLLEELQESAEAPQNVRNGNSEGQFSNLEEKTDYYIFTFGYRSGKATTALTKKSFTTQSSEVADDMTITFDITDIKDTYILVTITPSKLNSPYFWDITTPDATDQDIDIYLQEAFEYYHAMGKFQTLVEYLNFFASYGVENTSRKSLEPDTAYKLFAFGFDRETGEITTTIQYSGKFKTLK